MIATRQNEKHCIVCERLYTVQRMGQVVCGPSCARKVPALARKAERETTKQRLDALDTKPMLTKRAQTAFNAFVRARDAGKPCISCGKPYDSRPNMWDCGHYRGVGSAVHMRFTEDNAAGQCKHCNNYLAGNVVEYRKGLIDRIGLEVVELIERDQTLRRYTREGLQEIARHYNAEARRLKVLA